MTTTSDFIKTNELSNSTSITSDTGVTNGTGVFDAMMNTLNLHLNNQYNNGRLTGAEYANVLLNSTQSIITQSIEVLYKRDMLVLEYEKVKLQKVPSVLK